MDRVLIIENNFTSKDTATSLYNFITQLHGRDRCQIQYGKVYTVGNIKDGPPLPDVLRDVANTIDTTINNCVVNVYPPHTCISTHIDDTTLGPVIYGLSLGSPTTLVLHDPRSTDESKLQYTLEPGSLYTLAGNYRYNWCHSTLPDNIDTRVSLTFRTIEI